MLRNSVVGSLVAQAAYGIMCEVESHPFPLDEMLFMDWRAYV